MNIGQRLRYFFADTWWRALWLWGGILWCVALNVLIVAGGADPAWIGPVSVIPVLAFAAATIRRDRRLRR